MPLPALDPARQAEIVALGKDLSLAFELGALRLVLGRVVASIDEDTDDRRLVQNVAALGNAIVRLVQTQARVVKPASELDAAIARALDELDRELGDLPSFEESYPAPPGSYPDDDAAGIVPTSSSAGHWHPAATPAPGHPERGEGPVLPAPAATGYGESDPSPRLATTGRAVDPRATGSAWRPVEAAGREPRPDRIARASRSTRDARAGPFRDPPARR